MNLKRQVVSSIAAGLTALTIMSAASAAPTTTNLIVTPSSPVFDANNVTGVVGDSAPGYPFGSFASDGSGKV